MKCKGHLDMKSIADDSNDMATLVLSNTELYVSIKLVIQIIFFLKKVTFTPTPGILQDLFCGSEQWIVLYTTGKGNFI